MKPYTLIALLLSLTLMAKGQTTSNTPQYDGTRSYRTERHFLDKEGTKYVDNVAYLDGFGRTLQETRVKASPGGTADLIVPHAYGVQGRKEKEYLPFAKAGNNGAFVADAYSANNWTPAYGAADASCAYTNTEYDGSPLDRMVKQTGSGAVWHTAGKGVTSEYSLNSAGEVRLYKADLFTGVLSLNGYYRAGSLEKVITTDEDGHRVETFTDNMGHTLLTLTVDDEEEVKALSSSAGKAMDGNTEHAAGSTASPSVDREQTGTISPTASVTSKRLETYYIYDDRDRLRWVLSPEASHRLGNTVKPDILQKLAYYYAYDRLGRMTERAV